MPRVGQRVRVYPRDPDMVEAETGVRVKPGSTGVFKYRASARDGGCLFVLLHGDTTEIGFYPSEVKELK